MKILVTDKLSDEGLKLLKAEGIPFDVKTGLSEEDLCKTIPGYSAHLIRSGTKVTAKVIEASSGLKVIGRAGVGVDNVDIQAATKKGVIVMNTPDGNTLSTAELAMGLIVAVARRIPQACNSTRSGGWDRKGFLGTELAGKTLGILGLGRIGNAVAQRAKAFDMTLIAFDPYVKPEDAKKLGIELVPTVDALYARADFITLHVKKTPETTRMLNAAAFAKMKKGVRIVNCSRGDIVDDQALLEAIKSGQVAGAALDVFEPEPPAADNPLLKEERIIVTCHLGANTLEAQEKVTVQVIQQVVTFLKTGKVINAVNKI